MQEDMRKYLDIAGVMFVVLDVDQTVRLINKKGCEILEYEEKDILGKNWFDNFIPARIKDELKKNFTKLISSDIEPVEYFQNPILTKNGEERLIAWHNSILKNEDGQIISSLSCGEDITEQKQAEEELRNSEERYRQLVEISPAGIVVHYEGKIIFVNPAGLKLIGASSHDEIIGKPVIDFAHPDYRDVIKKRMEDAMSEKGKIPLLEEKFIKFDGTVIDVEVVGTPFFYKGKQAIQLIIRDITKRKRNEEELKTYREGLENLVEERTQALKQTLKELSWSNAELQQFAYVASHDLQEYLSMAGNSLNILERRYKAKLDDDADKVLNYGINAITQMQQFINAMLSYSKIGTRDKIFERISCESVFKRVINNMDVVIEKSSAMITTEALPTIIADESQFVELFQNLLDNAIKFRRSDAPQIHISAKQQNNKWLFGFQDNGIGIEPEYFERIFIIFQRLQTKTKYPGTGIGLAICRKIVERHGGSIWVESIPDKGSTFYFTIPLEPQ